MNCCNNHITDNYEYALKSNLNWAKYKRCQNPALFERTKDKQSPKILWIGCSDSRVPETTILGLEPGDVFTHRNIANIVSPTDINSMAVIEYAVVNLQVEDIIVCGHSRCGGAEAALSDDRVGGVIDHWITPLRALRRRYADIIDQISDKKDKGNKLSKLGVEWDVHNLLNNYAVRDAIKKRGLEVHGCFYNVATGEIEDLSLGTDVLKKLTIEEKQNILTDNKQNVCSNDYESVQVQ